MKQMEEKVEIPISKQKTVLMLVGSVLFVALGAWLAFWPPEMRNAYWGSPVRLMVAGYASIVFFGLLAVFFARRLSDGRLGLVVDGSGLTDHSGWTAAGHIPWHDIEEIGVLHLQGQRLVMIRVKNPQDYIGRQPNLLKRKVMEMNHNMYGTPLSITANGLAVGTEELVSLLAGRLEASRRGGG